MGTFLLAGIDWALSSVKKLLGFFHY